MLDLGLRQRLVDLGLLRQLEHAVGFGRALGKSVGDLRQRFCPGDTDGDRHPGPLFDRAPDFSAVLCHIIAQARKVQKSFVDGIHLDLGREVAQRLHHAARHVGVKGIVGRQRLDAVLVRKILDLEKRHPHPDAEPFGLVRPRDHAAVVIGKHHDRPVLQRGIENPLTRDVEVIAIGEGE